MICYICESSDWHRPLSQTPSGAVPIHSKATLQICKNCGSACHEVDPSKEAEIKNFYRKDYRPQPTVTNLITTSHKEQYIRVFLGDFLKKARDENRVLTVGDVGAATGYLPAFFRSLGHRATGCELTITYRRTAEHFYGIPLTEELEPKHKYDLITVYHVLEHLMEPDKKLAHYASLLADGGHLLVATPEWFDMLEESAGLAISNHPDMTGFEHLFHKNHINIFSKTSLQNLFRKCGLQVVKEDFCQYGQTYLLKKRDGGRPENWLTKEDWHEVERVMMTQKRAIELFCAGQPRAAFETYARFPDAWLAFIMTTCSKDEAKQIDTFMEADKHVSDNYKYKLAKSQWFFQHGQLGKAIEGLKEVLALKPNEDSFIFLAYALAQAGRPGEAIASMRAAASMCPAKWAECHTWILNLASQMPTWDERLMAEAQQAFASQQMQAKTQPANG